MTLPVTKERFLTYHTPVPESGCWLWLGYVNHSGYGELMKLGKKIGAHRMAWELHNGPIPDGLCVCHKCDVKTCVNPDHLFLGTIAENLEDMTKKGRRVYGDAHGRSKLTQAQVLQIRADTRSQSAIGADFGVSFQCVSKIKRFEKWKHLPSGQGGR